MKRVTRLEWSNCSAADLYNHPSLIRLKVLVPDPGLYRTGYAGGYADPDNHIDHIDTVDILYP